ncbi:DUF4097 domain-containing protein [Lentilactobacillus sp. IMAU92037]|uniref:DUF4097 family beta strand repeat-containing protein n=1 Tax=Lentilactobacillus TaxID=2767893 RepID=UPI001C259DAE|nr:MULTISPECIES: DUF4097 family beta strand repeat-containing protein [Lentilactobacillus]MBU9789927.1 DUF4097 domain-containing protein [Lentilactobacillus dabitei]MBV0930366.1 DUF4097 domain-containing protein [Lentilactobacillus dabitei]MDM7517591.1 DUF4097 family beta strand repeat-containing protein [Lentilactobacillus sp. TOM.63]
MKKSIVIGSALTIIGVIMVAVALGHTGFKPIVWANGFKVDDEQGTAIKMKTKQLDRSFDQLNFTTDSEVVVQPGNVKRPTIEYPKFNIVTQTGTAITIKGKQQHRTRIMGLSINSYQNNGGTITITLPKHTQLARIDGHNDNEVSLTNVAVNQLQLAGDAEINLENVTAKAALDLKNTDDTNLKNVTAPGITQSSDGGDLTYQNTDFANGTATVSTDGGDVSFTATKLKDAVINTDGGDVVLNNNRVNSSLTASTDGGDIDATIPNRKQVQVSASADGGDVSLFGQSGNHSWQIAQNNRPLYRLTSDGGDVTVR